MSTYTQSQLYQLALGVGLSGTNAQIAAAIAMAESGGDSNAINPGNANDPEYSVGLWQINIRAHPQYSKSSMLVPQNNALAMFAISSGGTNWSPWGTYTSGAYRSFLSNPVSGSATPFTSSTTQSTGSGQYLGLSLKKNNPATTTDLGSAWTYILAYTVAILMLVFIAHFEAGYNFLYYIAVLTLIWLFLTESTFISEALKPITAPQSVSGASGNF